METEGIGTDTNTETEAATQTQIQNLIFFISISLVDCPIPEKIGSLNSYEQKATSNQSRATQVCACSGVIEVPPALLTDD